MKLLTLKIALMVLIGLVTPCSALQQLKKVASTVTSFVTSGPENIYDALKRNFDDTVCKKLIDELEELNEYSEDDQGSVLHFACKYGREKICHYLINKGACVTVVRIQGITPLHLACLRGHSTICQLLLEKKADALAQDSQGVTPLLCACYKGNVEICDSLLAYKGHENLQYKNNQSPLHCACEKGHRALCCKLIKIFGVNNRNAYGQTPLHIACDNGHTQLVGDLLRRGADIEAYDNMGFAPFHFACSKGFRDICVILLNHKGDRLCNARNKENATPLHLACLAGRKDVCKLLLDRDINMVHTLNNYDETPLMCASRKGHAEICSLFPKFDTVEEDATVSEIYHRTPLHIASFYAKAAVCKKLFDKNVRVLTKDAAHATPLHYACIAGDDTVLGILLDRCDGSFAEEEKDLHGFIPLHYASMLGYTSLCQRLINKNESSVNVQNYEGDTPLHLACAGGHLGVCTLLLSYKADVNLQNKLYETPLMCACKGGCDDIEMSTFQPLWCRKKPSKLPDPTRALDYQNICRNLLGQVNHLIKRRRGSRVEGTALHIACLYQQNEIFNVLIEHNFDPNEKAIFHLSLLHIACLSNNTELFEQLLKVQKDINAQDIYGDTPLHYVCRQKNALLEKLVSQATINLSAKNCYDETPIGIAIDADDEEFFMPILQTKVGVREQAMRLKRKRNDSVYAARRFNLSTSEQTYDTVPREDIPKNLKGGKRTSMSSSVPIDVVACSNEVNDGSGKYSASAFCIDYMITPLGDSRDDQMSESSSEEDLDSSQLVIQ